MTTVTTDRSKVLNLLKIDRFAMSPHHQQLEDQLLAAMAQGRLKAGDPLPSERELSEALGISRMTVRAALIELEGQGRLKSQVGKGWYVSPFKIEQTLSKLTSFTTDMQAMGYTVRSRVLSFEQTGASEELAQSFGIAVGEAVYLLDRLRMVNDEPVGVEHTCVAARTFPGLERFDFAQRSLYGVMHEEYGQTPAWAVQQVEASAADKRESALLGIRAGAPVLRSHRMVYSPQNVVLEDGRATYRGDRYKYRVRLSGDSQAVGIL
ncbi:MAG: GntR family transcriptional regulator [Chloroflexi bacterium]|nr:GntR family transcriptional regulator [Chloroflexota bacterium]MBI3734406.1 GntR family transcriptional regulator [Chloroflexota bacterium]